MISAELIQTVEDLLAAGELSHRKIARLTGVGRTTVGAVARGKVLSRERAMHLVVDAIDPSAPPHRCPGCGGMVRQPCQLCHARNIKRRNTTGRDKAGAPVTWTPGEPQSAA